MKNILILGEGAREHAIADKFYQDDDKANIIRISYTNNLSDILNIIDKNNINLVFAANEQFLADGVIDVLNKMNIKAIGPTKDAARIETSKSYAKNLMKKYNIPTANYETFVNLEKAIDYIDNKKTFPVVIKADGLAAGKGVLIAENKEIARDCIFNMLNGNKFGAAGKEIVIEDFLHGEEASIFAFCDGKNFVSTIFSKDHKRAFDGDKGLNTGGMGAFAPVDKFSHLQEKVDSTIFQPILNAMKEDGCPFSGVLYAGLMINGDDIYVVEFNCRLGDPETQVLLPILENDLFEICDAIYEQRINKIKLSWKEKYAVGVVLASKGYPEYFETGHNININEKISQDNKLKLFMAGIKKEGDCYINSGGRVMTLCAIDDTLIDAKKYVYDKINLIVSDILYYRKDIAAL